METIDWRDLLENRQELHKFHREALDLMSGGAEYERQIKKIMKLTRDLAQQQDEGVKQIIELMLLGTERDGILDDYNIAVILGAYSQILIELN